MANEDRGSGFTVLGSGFAVLGETVWGENGFGEKTKIVGFCLFKFQFNKIRVKWEVKLNGV